MKHFWNPPQGEAKRDNNPRERSCAQCVVCGQELFQRLMSRGLSDRGRLHILFHPLGPLGCCRPQAQVGAICSLSQVRRAWPHGAGCSSCRCGAETASDGQSRDATRRAWLHFHVMKALVMRDLVVAHRCPGPPSALVADSRLLSPRTSLGRGYGDGMGC